MTQKNLSFDPLCDIKPVSQTGFIDLVSAYQNNCVPSQLPNSESDYNGIEEPESILGKPSDVFEAMEMESYVNDASSSKNKETDSASS